MANRRTMTIEEYLRYIAFCDHIGEMWNTSDNWWLTKAQNDEYEYLRHTYTFLPHMVKKELYEATGLMPIHGTFPVEHSPHGDYVVYHREVERYGR